MPCDRPGLAQGGLRPRGETQDALDSRTSVPRAGYGDHERHAYEDADKQRRRMWAQIRRAERGH